MIFITEATAKRIEGKIDALGKAFNELGHRLDRESDRQKKWETAMDARIERAINAITALKTLDDSLKASVAAKDVELQAGRDQIAALQAKLDSGETIAKEDLAALGTVLDNLGDINAADATSVVANTEAAPAG